MSDYHKYVFNLKSREFVGDFDQMYQNELVDRYDSWNQDQIGTPELTAATDIIERYEFRSILDIGCGKGAYTFSLATADRKITGLDLSETAIQVASARYPDIGFKQLDVSISEDLEGELINGKKNDQEFIDLVLFSEVLSYLDNWQQTISLVSNHAKNIFIKLYIPENPIGFVKNFASLESSVSENFNISERMILNDRIILLLAKSKHTN